jgi:hypothetical protein
VIQYDVARRVINHFKLKNQEMYSRMTHQYQHCNASCLERYAGQRNNKAVGGEKIEKRWPQKDMENIVEKVVVNTHIY